jgi:hypothetical protein
MTKHEIILYWSDEDQSFIAEVPELAGSAADGATHRRRLPMSRSSSTSGLRRPRSLGVLFRSPRAGCCSCRSRPSDSAEPPGRRLRAGSPPH